METFSDGSLNSKKPQSRGKAGRPPRKRFAEHPEGNYRPAYRPSFFTPFLKFLNTYRKSKAALPEIKPHHWRCIYFLNSSKNPCLLGNELERKKSKELQAWIYENKHIKNWLHTKPSMYAPREYIIPGLRKLLLVSPQRLGAHLFPLYDLDLLSGVYGYNRVYDAKQEQIAYKTVRSRYNGQGLQYLIAHCHGVSTSRIQSWTGLSEKKIKLAVLEAVDPFVNTLPYLIWAYNVDMAGIPFTKRKGISKFRNRFKRWENLDHHPQFSCPTEAKIFLPSYLQNPHALKALGENRRYKKSYEIDKMFSTVPKNLKEIPKKYRRTRPDPR